MNLCITNIRPASDNEWDDVWNNCNYATYFHGRRWAEIWSKYYKGRLQPIPSRIQFSDGESAIFPLSQEIGLGGVIRRVISSPAGTYGGWISSGRLTEEHARLLVGWMRHNHRNFTWRQNPYDPTGVAPPFDSKPDHTQTIRLNIGFEAIVRQWKKGHRSAVNKAVRNGVKISVAQTKSEWYDYFVTYEDSLRRWGSQTGSRYDRSLFEILRHRATLDDDIKLWLASDECGVIAGAVCVYSPRIAVYWHGAALERSMQLRPVNLLMYEAIRDAATRGLAWFDFNPSGGHMGVEAFKRSFGTQQISASVTKKSSIDARVFREASRLWSKFFK